MFGSLRTDQRAFTLVEILVVLAVFGVLMTFFFSFNNFFQGKGQVDKTRKRMEKIVSAAQEYYLSHENLPVLLDPAGDYLTDVPVDALNLEARYRLDPWGQPFQYFTFRNDGIADGPIPRDGEILIDTLSPGAPPETPPDMVIIAPGTRTLIRAVEINGKRVAGVIISRGPDQVFDADYPQNQAENSYAMEFTPVGDDMFIAIDVNQQATRIALSELKVLNDKAKAFDERFVGIDNSPPGSEGAGQYDEDLCLPIPYPDPTPPDYVAYEENIGSCDNFPQIPEGSYMPFHDEVDDVSCGMPTLDLMKARFCDLSLGLGCNNNGYYFPRIYQYAMILVGEDWVEDPCGYIEPDYFRIPFIRGEPAEEDCHWGLVNSETNFDETIYDQARAFIFCLNNLSSSAIVDPWLNGYIWGCGNEDECSADRYYPNGDPHHHRFFSAGPDGLPAPLEIDQAETDDIIS